MTRTIADMDARLNLDFEEPMKPLKKVAFYPGSFNPWHEGHADVLDKALELFDHVVIAPMTNPTKSDAVIGMNLPTGPESKYGDQISVFSLDSGLMVDAISDWEKMSGSKISAVLRGLRNGHDLQYEMNLQYWNEDLGLKVPVVYFVTDRKLAHISSSAIRALRGVKRR